MKEMDEKNIAIANEHMRKTIIIDCKSVSTNAPKPKNCCWSIWNIYYKIRLDYK